MNLSAASKNAMLEALAGYINTGNSSATLTLYSSELNNASIPLAAFELPNPLGTVSQGSLTVDAISTLATGTGAPIWAQIVNGNGDVVADLVANTDFTLEQPSVYAGGNCTLTSLTVRI